MIYFDATGACKSAKNTGMQRTSRRIYSELAKRVPIVPIAWNWIGRHFHLLGRREFEFFEAPFQVDSRPTARPDWRGEKFFGEVNRLLFRKSVPLEITLTSRDVLFVPDIYRDARMRLFPQVLKKTGARGIAIFHDAAELDLPQLYPGGAKSFRAYVESLAAFKHVICVSNSSCEHLGRLWQQFGLTAPPTSIASWPVEFNESERNDDSLQSRNLIVCVSSFEPRKNHIALFRAAKQAWDEGLQFELELIGRSTGYYGHKVIAELKRLQATGYNVKWQKHVSDESLHRAYRACRFVVYPSLMEGFGLPIAESLWHGKPVICGGNGALGEIARDGGCLIVDQASETGLAEGIKKLLTDQTLYDRLRIETRARTFSTWSDYIDNLLGHLSTDDQSQ